MNFCFKKVLFLFYFVKCVYSGSLQLTNANYDSTLGSNELVFINFYASWCRFSQMLEPIYDQFADQYAKEFPNAKVSIAKVNCESETDIASKNFINKYPTLKLYRHGVAVKKEYRGARSVEAFMAYVKEQMETPIKEVNNYSEMNKLDPKKRTIIGYFENKESENYKTFAKLASMLRDSCSFAAALGNFFSHKLTNGENVVFRDLGGIEATDLVYPNQINQYDALYAWANDRCTPLVREITFENAEELTEEGLPFLILFHKPDDLESVKVFEKEVQRQLVHEKSTINAVHADGHKFSHPLNHLGKSANDLPVLAIDSFRHMYLFPDYKKITEGEHLRQFVLDLHSGKLHREFHNGPDPTTEPPKIKDIQVVIGDDKHIPKIPENQDKNNVQKSTPPESVFIKLAPSSDRYSIKHDGEL